MPGMNIHHPELERAGQRVQRLWYDLAMAERCGQSADMLERLGRLYLCALEEYIQLARRLEQPLAAWSYKLAI